MLGTSRMQQRGAARLRRVGFGSGNTGEPTWGQGTAGTRAGSPHSEEIPRKCRTEDSSLLIGHLKRDTAFAWGGNRTKALSRGAHQAKQPMETGSGPCGFSATERDSVSLWGKTTLRTCLPGSLAKESCGVRAGQPESLPRSKESLMEWGPSIGKGLVA